MHEDEIGDVVVDEAISIHRAVGAGLLERVYEVLLAHALERRGLGVERQVPIPIECLGHRFDEGFRADVVVGRKVILELKSCRSVIRAHQKQLLTYLRLSNTRLGYLLNFGEPLMKDGITRIVNGLEKTT